MICRVFEGKVVEIPWFIGFFYIPGGAAIDCIFTPEN